MSSAAGVRPSPDRPGRRGVASLLPRRHPLQLAVLGARGLDHPDPDAWWPPALFAPHDVERIRQIKTWQAQRLSLDGDSAATRWTWNACRTGRDWPSRSFVRPSTAI